MRSKKKKIGKVRNSFGETEGERERFAPPPFKELGFKLD